MTERKLYRTTIVIWTEYDTSRMEIDAITREAMSGDAFCDHQACEAITNQSLFPDTEFFDDMELAHEDEERAP